MPKNGCKGDYKLICHFIWLSYSRMKYESLIVVTNRQRIGQELKLNVTAMLEKVNTTMNGTLPSSCDWNPTAEKIGKTFAYCLIFLVSQAGNIVIAIIVYKTKTMRKPINFLIVNMAISDLLLPIFLFPHLIQKLYMDSWLITGPLGQALCKLVFHCCVSSEPGFDSSRSIWSCGISPPSSTHQFKAVPVPHSRHLDRRDGSSLPISCRLQTC